jgi:exodeoxyribonuclease-5
MTTPTTPLWQRLTAAGAPRHVVAEQILVVWDWLYETFGEPLSSEVYNAITLEAIEAASLGDEPEPAPEPDATPARPAGPTADQQAAIDGILGDITQPSARPVLCGYAGTGKTFTTAQLVSMLTSAGKRVVVATPTHKARSQVARALSACGAHGFEAVTIHRLLGLKQVRDKSTGKETFAPDPGGKNMLTAKTEWDKETGRVVSVSPIDVIIVDETSMVGSELYDLLLSQAEKRPIVFVGDDRQLLPVGEDQACRAFSEGTSIYRLTEVLRHDGAILNLATATRLMDVGRAPFVSAEGGGSRVVAHRSREQWFSTLLDVAASEEAMNDPDFCRALAWTNKAVDEMNSRIHQRRYGANAPQFVEGMTCVTVDAIPDPATGDAPLLNSTVDVLVEKAKIIQRRILGDNLVDPLWNVWELTVSADGLLDPVTFLVMTDEEDQRWKASLKVIADEAKGASGQARKDLWDVWFRRRDSVGRLQPASALTTHKSQGSTFQNVFLHWSIDGWGSAPTAQQNQLAYVGITRAAESLHVVGDRRQ